MKYLSNEPFSSVPASSEYRDNWEATFGDSSLIRVCLINRIRQREPPVAYRCETAKDQARINARVEEMKEENLKANVHNCIELTYRTMTKAEFESLEHEDEI